MLEEAREMAEDAIVCTLKSALKVREPIPQDPELCVERADVFRPATCNC